MISAANAAPERRRLVGRGDEVQLAVELSQRGAQSGFHAERFA
jgi:hypothetical protein